MKTLLLIAILLLSCANNQNPKLPEESKGLETSITLNGSSFALGSRVEFSMTVTNNTLDTLELVFPDACRFDFSVMRDEGEIWSLLSTKSCAQVISRNKLAPGASMKFESSWDGMTSLPSARVILGKHKVVGILKTMPPIRTEEAVFYLTD